MDIGNDIKLPILNIGLEYLLSCFDFFDFPHLLLYKITWRGGGDEFNLTTFNHKKIMTFVLSFCGFAFFTFDC